MLTDSIANGLDELFQVGHEIVTFADDDDLINKAVYYLAHEDERLQIANAGYRRTTNEHTYAHRAQKIVETITTPGFQHLAPMRRADRRTRLAARWDVYTHLHMIDALLDETRAAGYNPLQRGWMVLPALARRLLR